MIDLSMISEMATKRSQKENYSCMMEIMNVAVCEGLREIFKQEWDKQYGTQICVWNDTSESGAELWKMEKTNKKAKEYSNVYQSGNRSEWDISALSYAILFSKALKDHLPPHVANKIDELRKLRNHLTHKLGAKHEMPEIAFRNACNKIKTCFKVLKLPTTNVDKVVGDFEERRLTFSRNNTNSFLLTFILFVVIAGYAFWHTFEAKPHFRHLPIRPVHLIANRSQTVDVILEELHNLSMRNNHQLTYFYIIGNPGSGKSQLARLVGQRYGNGDAGTWIRSAPCVFVMTLNGRSSNDILESYLDFSGRLNCDEDEIAEIKNSNRTKTDQKIEKLQREIARRLRKFKGGLTWLLIVDNVLKVSEMIPFLPALGSEDWQGGQVLITTQDMSSVPPNDSLTLQISISHGMHPEESRWFLKNLSGLVENEDLMNMVAKELDYQPLALAAASFYVKQVRSSKVSSRFTWKDYLKKLDEGKRELTEMRLKKVNTQAYSLSMSSAVLLAIKTFAERDAILKHVFTFFSYVSHELQPLQAVVSYVLRVDKENDKEDIELNIQQCSLIRHSKGQKVDSISLHRVVHQSIKMYIEKQKKEKNVPLHIIQILLSKNFVLGEIYLIPHLKAFSARIKNLTSISLVQTSMKSKRAMFKKIFDLSAALIEYGEALLVKKYLIFALKIGAEKNYSHNSFPGIGEVSLSLGTVENQLGNAAEGIIYWKKAIDILSKQYGPKHKCVSKCLMNLASIPCSTPKECDENKKYTKRMLRIDNSLKNQFLHHISVGNKNYVESKLAQAEEHYLQAYKILTNIFEAAGSRKDESWVNLTSRGTPLVSLDMNLGAIYHSLGKFERAKLFFNVAIRFQKQLAGPNQLDLGNLYFLLGTLHFQFNEFSEAENCYRRALEIFHHNLAPFDEKIAKVLQHLANVFEEREKLDEAMLFREQYGVCTPQH